MRLPFLPLVAGAAVLGGTITYATESWKWALPVAVAWCSIAFLAEWCVDAIVREIRRARMYR